MYSAGDVVKVATFDGDRVSQSAERGDYAEDAKYAIHQFKDYAGVETKGSFEWKGQSNCAPSTSTVFLQVFNRISQEWENLDSENGVGANIDFTLNGSIPNLDNYKDGNTIVSCRVYQRAGVIG